MIAWTAVWRVVKRASVFALLIQGSGSTAELNCKSCALQTGNLVFLATALRVSRGKRYHHAMVNGRGNAVVPCFEFLVFDPCGRGRGVFCRTLVRALAPVER